MTLLTISLYTHSSTFLLTTASASSSQIVICELLKLGCQSRSLTDRVSLSVQNFEPTSTVADRVQGAHAAWLHASIPHSARTPEIATPPSCCPSLSHSPRHLAELAKQTEQPHLRRPRVHALWHRKPPKLAHTSATASSASVAPPTSRSSQGEGEFRLFRRHRRGPTSPEMELTVAGVLRGFLSSLFLHLWLHLDTEKLVPSSAWSRQPHRRRIAAVTWPSAAALATGMVRGSNRSRWWCLSVRNRVGSV
jgi:hypothetical protein